MGLMTKDEVRVEIERFAEDLKQELLRRLDGDHAFHTVVGERPFTGGRVALSDAALAALDLAIADSATHVRKPRPGPWLEQRTMLEREVGALTNILHNAFVYVMVRDREIALLRVEQDGPAPAILDALEGLVHVKCSAREYAAALERVEGEVAAWIEASLQAARDDIKAGR